MVENPQRICEKTCTPSALNRRVPAGDVVTSHMYAATLLYM